MNSEHQTVAEIIALLVSPVTGLAPSTCSPVWRDLIELCPLDEGDTKVIPVLEEVVRVEEYFVLKGEVRIRRVRATPDSMALASSLIPGDAASMILRHSQKTPVS